MSSAPRSRLWRTIGVKLTVYSSAYFVASVLLVLGFAYVLLSSSLQRKDQQQIQWELDELVALYRTGGIVAVRDFLAAAEAAGVSEPFAVRWIGSDGTTRFVWKPPQLAAVDLEQLRTAPFVPEGAWVLRGVWRGVHPWK